MAASPMTAVGFTLEQVMGAPFAEDLVAAPDAAKAAWVSSAKGRRNIWVATPGKGGEFSTRVLTQYTADDGAEISDLGFVPRHEQLLFVRGGDIEYPDKPAPNPSAAPDGVVQEVFVIDLHGGKPIRLGAGHAPIASPDGSRILFLQKGQVMSAPARPGAEAMSLFKTRGVVDELRFSPDGKQLAFVTNRGDHSFVGVYRFADRALRWVDAGLGFDVEPRWSPDGGRIAFLRLPSIHDEVGMVAHRTGSPWTIRVATLSDGSVHEIYRAPAGPGSVFHPLSSDTQLVWSGDQIVFPAESDGWLHLYAVPVTGGTARLLTPGAFEIEYMSASADGSAIVYAGNQGDIDRRHLWRLTPADGHVEALTTGTAIETQPVLLADRTTVAFLKSDARTPMHAAFLVPGKPPVDWWAEGLGADFPKSALAEPISVTLPERAGVSAHGQIFLPPTGSGSRHPALVFMHGGPVRQMLVGFHYMDYYSNAYAMNQYLASLGYVVLALNYRAGIGYGLDFREADHIGSDGAAEYNDVLAAAEYLKSRPDVDSARIGLWGGSYGGYLTALGLGRNSDLFAAGVDLHGVHDWHRLTIAYRDGMPLYPLDAPPAAVAMSFASSPMSAVATWRSPVLLIHGDSDSNVAFAESVRLAEALRAQGVEYEQLVFPDEIHGFLKHESWLRAYGATADFFDRRLLRARSH
jgi:dipeptidyl aminopeptidase/acylaminoacyl peptidase